MDGNGTNNGPGGPMSPPARRPYKRISPQEWEAQKDLIRILFLDQDRSTAQIAEIMKDQHGFDAGEKQFKRKVEEWGFSKNITGREMLKMVRKRKRREEDQKETVFKRARNGVDFDLVPTAKLDRFERRNKVEELESGSQSSGMPSNIQYGTPSNSLMVRSTSRNRGTILSGSPAPSDEMQSSSHASQQVRHILGRAFNQSTSRSPFSPVARYGREGSLLAFQERFNEARLAFERDSAQTASWRGKRCWLAVAFRHLASMMEVASHPGCPQTLSLRLTQELSRALMVEEQSYLALPSNEQSPEELQEIMSALVSGTQLWTEIITTQRLLKNLSLLTIRSDPELMVLYRRREAHKRVEYLPIEEVIWNLRRPATPFQPSQHLLHSQYQGPADKLLDLVPLLQFSTNELSSGVENEMFHLCRGRSYAFLGGYYSFLRQFEKAEQAFQESAKALEGETCVEIKLHRMLWHSEHCTRVKNWVGVSVLLYEAHRVFMAQETTSTFVLSHFPDRFRLLCKAISACVPIDEVVYDVAVYSRNNPDGNREKSSWVGTPQAPSPVLEVERLFPLGSTDHSTIDVNAWRQYVTFSP